MSIKRCWQVGQVRFSSAILPAYLRRTKSIEERLPWLYLKGISTAGFSDALAALLGRDAPGLSPGTISRLKSGWQAEHARWETRNLAGKQYVYVWVDGLHFGVRLEAAKQCILVVSGAPPEGKKERVALSDGFRESEPSWKEGLMDLQQRGLKRDPKRAIGEMVRSVFGKRYRRCLGPRGHRVAGCTNGPRPAPPPMCSISCLSMCKPRRSPTCSRSGWPRHATMPTQPSLRSCRSISPSIRRRRSAWPKTKNRYSNPLFGTELL